MAQSTARLKRLVGSNFDLRADIWGDFGWRLPKPPGPKTTAGKLAGVRNRQAARERKKRAGRAG